MGNFELHPCHSSRSEESAVHGALQKEIPRGAWNDKGLIVEPL
jgi:hypothetical protein